jgi:hypothetical protein
MTTGLEFGVAAPAFPPPLRGRDREGGGGKLRSLLPPPSPPLPRKGGGSTPYSPQGLHPICATQSNKQ